MDKAVWRGSPMPIDPLLLLVGRGLVLDFIDVRIWSGHVGGDPLTEVKSMESGIVDVVNIEVTGKVVKMMCAPYKDPQDPLKFLEALDTVMIILNANLADGADLVGPVVMAKLIDNPETVLVMYGEVETVWEPCKQFWRRLELRRTITGMK